MRRKIAIFMCFAFILTGYGSPIDVVAGDSPFPMITVDSVLPENVGRIEVNNAVFIDGQPNQYTVHQSGDEVDIVIERNSGYEIDSVAIGADTYMNDVDFIGAVTGSAITVIRSFSKE